MQIFNMNEKQYLIKMVNDSEYLIVIDEDGIEWHVPQVIGNRMHDDYLVWKLEGNVPKLIEGE